MCRWERVKIAVDGLVSAQGETSSDPVATIRKRYEIDETDEFFKPIIVGGDETRIKGEYARYIYGFPHITRQTRIPCFSSTIARIVCVRLCRYSVCLTSRWRSQSPASWYAPSI